jgi:1-acyl-sn-glycerol-3-phosphate acyltransferase
MKKNKIYKWSLFYEILRWFVRIAHRLFYSSVVVIGKENIPEGVPVIFAPNHQNALMDPLAIVCTLPDQVVFLARADIFSNKIARFFLRFLKILPVYRIRDGKENLDNNQYIFDLSVEVLKNN